MSLSTTDILQNNAVCLEQCVRSEGMANAIIIYLLQKIAGNTMTTDQLQQNAVCIEQCIRGPGMQRAVMIYLLMQLVPGGGTSPTGVGGVTFGNYGGVQPAFTPSLPGIYVDTSQLPSFINIWYWTGSAWIQG